MACRSASMAEPERAEPSLGAVAPGGAERLATVPVRVEELRAEAGRRVEPPNRWRLAARLCRRYSGVQLEDLYDTETVPTPYGPCLHLMQRIDPFVLAVTSAAAVEEAVLSELRLVYGIGPVTAGLLRAQGVGRITDLVGDHRFGGSASWLAERWDRRDLGVLHDHIRHRLAGAGHGLSVLLTGLVPPAGLVMVDLETLGLWGSPMVLFGFARLAGGSLEVHQYLVRAGREEPAALHLALEVLRGCEGMVTYNGRTADSPWLRQRCAYFGLGKVPESLHLDLLHLVRRRYRDVADDPGCDDGDPRPELRDCRLATVEAHVLGIERDLDDLPGEAVPHFYREYERRQNIGPLVPIIDHNRADLVAVARLLCLFSADPLNDHAARH